MRGDMLIKQKTETTDRKKCILGKKMVSLGCKGLSRRQHLNEQLVEAGHSVEEMYREGDYMT